MKEDYPYRDYWQITEYVVKTHLRTLPEVALYRSLGELEVLKGHGAWFLATFRKIQKASGVHRNSIRRTLESLRQKGLIEVRFGSQVKSQAMATEIRRRTQTELKDATCEGESVAARFARILNEQPLAGYGQPTWQVSLNGKLRSSKHDFQTQPDDTAKPGRRTRSQIVMDAAQEGEVQFVKLDIKRAEPTLVLYDLKMPTGTDLYQLYMDGKPEKDRQKAKKAVNALANCKSWTFFYEAMPAELRPYCEALQAKRESVKREADRTGFITTLTGRKIERPAGRFHTGQIYNARIAGTVADIINQAGLDLYDLGCRCWPVSDCLYVLAPEGVDVAGKVRDRMTTLGFTFLKLHEQTERILTSRVVNRVPDRDSITPVTPDNLSLTRTEALSPTGTA